MKGLKTLLLSLWVLTSCSQTTSEISSEQTEMATEVCEDLGITFLRPICYESTLLDINDIIRLIIKDTCNSGRLFSSVTFSVYTEVGDSLYNQMVTDAIGEIQGMAENTEIEAKKSFQSETDQKNKWRFSVTKQGVEVKGITQLRYYKTQKVVVIANCMSEAERFPMVSDVFEEVLSNIKLTD